MSRRSPQTAENAISERLGVHEAVFGFLHLATLVILIITITILFQRTTGLQGSLPSARHYGSFYNNTSQLIVFGQYQLVNYTSNLITSTSGIQNNYGVFTLVNVGVYQFAWVLDVGTPSETILAVFLAQIDSEQTVIPYQPTLTQIQKIGIGASNVGGSLTISTTIPSQNIGLFVQLSESLSTQTRVYNTAISVVKIDI